MKNAEKKTIHRTGVSVYTKNANMLLHPNKKKYRKNWMTVNICTKSHVDMYKSEVYCVNNNHLFCIIFCCCFCSTKKKKYLSRGVFIEKKKNYRRALIIILK